MTNQDAEPRKVAAERWWHRLLRVVGYGLALVVLSVSLLVQIETAQYYTYTYSFQSNFTASNGDEFKCQSYESIKSISCGEFSDGDAFINFYLSIVGNDKLRDGTMTINELFADLRAEGHKDSDLAVDLIARKGYSYRLEKHWDMRKLLMAIATAFGITLATFVALVGLYKVILFIVHGHTRVVRE